MRLVVDSNCEGQHALDGKLWGCGIKISQTPVLFAHTTRRMKMDLALENASRSSLSCEGEWQPWRFALSPRIRIP